jgi:hypothetical protein
MGLSIEKTQPPAVKSAYVLGGKNDLKSRTKSRRKERKVDLTGRGVNMDVVPNYKPLYLCT